LRVLQELIAAKLEPEIALLRAVRFADVSSSIRELEAKICLSWTPDEETPSPAELVAFRASKVYEGIGDDEDRDDFYAGERAAFQWLAKIGGAAPFWEKLSADPQSIESEFLWLLDEPMLLNLFTKREWLGLQLSQRVGDADESDLQLVVCRENVLDGLCAAMGVDEATGQLAQGTVASGISVQYMNEAAEGDALRREWFDQVLAEMLDPDRGLFLSKDGNRTRQPNPNSATTAGADHLSYFALLGRITGLALYHRETVNAFWSKDFLKAAFGYSVEFEDLESADPGLYKSLMDLRTHSSKQIEASCLTFSVDCDEAIVYETPAKRRRSVELKPGGDQEAVTASNVNEYLQLYAQHKLIGAIQRQVTAFREGLAVFFDEALLTKLRSCCTVADVQLLLCGTTDIDVNDWESSSRYEPSVYAQSPQVVWFWKFVRDMQAEERAKLLFFCTGSMRPPATGFGSLMGFNGGQNRFTVAQIHGGDHGRLPTASACFNKLYLPGYASEDELRVKLRQALSESEGFHEAAVAI
jgi:hypothetical protein